MATALCRRRISACSVRMAQRAVRFGHRLIRLFEYVCRRCRGALGVSWPASRLCSPPFDHITAMFIRRQQGHEPLLTAHNVRAELCSTARATAAQFRPFFLAATRQYRGGKTGTQTTADGALARAGADGTEPRSIGGIQGVSVVEVIDFNNTDPLDYV